MTFSRPTALFSPVCELGLGWELRGRFGGAGHARHALHADASLAVRPIGTGVVAGVEPAGGFRRLREVTSRYAATRVFEGSACSSASLEDSGRGVTIGMAQFAAWWPVRLLRPFSAPLGAIS